MRARQQRKRCAAYRLRKTIRTIREFSPVQGLINPRAFGTSKVTPERVQTFWQPPLDQVQRARGVLVHSAQHFGIDVLGAQDVKRGRGKCLFPLGKAVSKAKVRVEKMSARSQYPRYLFQKSRKVWITMRRLDIDQPIECAGRKRQVFRVTLHEDQSRNLMTLFAKANSGRIQVQGQGERI